MLEIERNILKKQPKQNRSRVTVEAIIEATTRILEREGRTALTTNRVAQVAGVSVGALYQYFPNKEALLAEVKQRYDLDFTARMAAQLGRLAQLPLRQAVCEFIHFLIEIHAENPKLHNAVAAEVPASEEQLIREFARAYFETHRDEIRPLDLELATYILLEAGEALIHETALHEPERLRDKRFEEEVCELFLRYLAV